MVKKSLRLVAILAALAIAVPIAWAGGGGGGGGRGGRGGRGGGGGFGGGDGGGPGAFGGGGPGGGGPGMGGGMGMQGNNNFGGIVLNGAGGGGGRGGMGFTLNVDAYFYANEYAILSQQLTLTDDEKPKLKARIDTMNAELQTYVQNIAPPQGPAGATQTAQLLKLADDYTSIALQHQLKIDSDLTDAQKVQWEAFKLHRVIDARLALAELTDDQTARIKSLIDDTAKAIAALTDTSELPALTGRVYRRIIADVLTEPQAAKLVTDITTLPGGGRVPSSAAGGGIIGIGNMGGGQGGFGGGGMGGGNGGFDQGGQGGGPGGGGRGGRGGRGGGPGGPGGGGPGGGGPGGFGGGEGGGGGMP